MTLTEAELRALIERVESIEKDLLGPPTALLRLREQATHIHLAPKTVKALCEELLALRAALKYITKVMDDTMLQLKAMIVEKDT